MNPPAAFRAVSILAFACLAAGRPAGAADDPVPPTYRPMPVAAPSAGAPYLLPDGSIHVIGNDLVDGLFARFNEIYTKAHPGFRFSMQMPGSPAGIPGIISRKSAFAPMGREAVVQELAGFKARFGYEPTDFQIGYDQSPNPDIFPPAKTPSAIWISVKNPLPKLTVEQAARVFTTGGGAGDITHWSQLGLGGEWATREIHVYLPANRDAVFLFSAEDRFGGRPWTRRAEWLPGVRNVMAAVAQDPFGIGLIGYWPPDYGWDRQGELQAQLKIVAMGESEDGHFSHAGLGDRYPLAGGIHIYVDRAPGKQMEPWLADYIRLALSKEGQAIIASMTGSDGFIPLEPEKIAPQLAKLK